MGVRFLIDDSDRWPIGALYCSTTGAVFGPLFEGSSSDIRDDVWEWMQRTCDRLGKDARRATFDELVEARDATARAVHEVEIGGEG